MPLLTVEIGGTAWPLKADTYRLQDDVTAGPNTLRFTIRDDNAAVNVERRQLVQVKDGPTVTWEGFVDSATARRIVAKATNPTAVLEVDVEAIPNRYRAGKRRIAESYLDAFAGDIVRDIISGFLGQANGGAGILQAEGVTAGTIDTGPFLAEVTYNYVTVADGLDRLAQEVGFAWWIDEQRQLHFTDRGTVAAPWSLTATDVQGDPRLVERQRLYRNSQLVKGGTGLTDPQVERFQGDGERQTFSTGFAIGQVPTVEVDTGGGFTAQTVGIRGIDTGRQWYWSKGEHEVTQDLGDTALAATHKLRVTYVGMFPMIAVSSDPAAQTVLAAREGAGSSGIVEHVEENPDITTVTGGLIYAANLLQQYTQEGRELTFVTRRAGLAAGQLLDVTLPDLGASGQYLVTQVTTSDVGGVWLQYTVRAIQGPITEAWPTLWAKAITQPAVLTIRENLQEAEQVVILAGPFAESVDISAGEAVAVNVFPCPIPSASLFPSASLLPC